jgi:hypothetical protein
MAKLLSVSNSIVMASDLQNIKMWNKFNLQNQFVLSIPESLFHIS